MKRHKPLLRKKGLSQHNNWIPKKARQAGLLDYRPKKLRIPKRAYFHKSRPRPPATKAESAHMSRVARLGCIACRHDGKLRKAAIHHVREGYGASQRASHWEVLPLCEPHHQGDTPPEPGEVRVIAFHRGERTWTARYGNEIELLQEVYATLGLDFERLPEFRGSEPPWWQAYKEGRLVTEMDDETRKALTYFEEEVIDG